MGVTRKIQVFYVYLKPLLTHDKSCMAALKRKLKNLRKKNVTHNLLTPVTPQWTFGHISYQDFFRCRLVCAEGAQGQEQECEFTSASLGFGLICRRSRPVLALHRLWREQLEATREVPGPEFDREDI